MNDLKFHGTPSLDDFLSAILDKPSRVDTTAFTAAILGEQNFNSNQPRDEKGRWTSGGLSEKSADKLRQDALDALSPKTPPGKSDAAKADANSAFFRAREFTSTDGIQHIQAQFAGFDKNGNVLLRRMDKDLVVTARPEHFDDGGKKVLADFAKLGGDEGFKAGMESKPSNVHLDSSGIERGRQLDWEAQVVRDIGKLSELKSGRELLDALKTQAKEVQIKSHTSGDNKASGNTVYFDPDRTKGPPTRSGDDQRPPFLGLGQELFNAMANLSRETTSLAQREENGLRFGQRLRIEYNKTVEDADWFKKLARRYSSRMSHRGWETRMLDEDVLGLDGRPLRKRRGY